VTCFFSSFKNPPKQTKSCFFFLSFFLLFSRKIPNGRKADSLQPLPTFKLLREEEPSGSSASGHLGLDQRQTQENGKQKKMKQVKEKGRCKRKTAPSSSVSTIRMMD
jgi:hypothetical protein